MNMKVGDKFSTPFEKGCVVTKESDIYGNFLALDSDGIECQFNEVMIEEVEVKDGIA
jgi:hypothetical protein